MIILSWKIYKIRNCFTRSINEQITTLNIKKVILLLRFFLKLVLHCSKNLAQKYNESEVI